MTWLRILRVTTLDVSEKPTGVMCYLTADAVLDDAASALEDALLLASVGNPFRGTVETLALPEWDYPASPGSSGPYQGFDIALFEFSAEDGTVFRYTVSCPSTDLFYPDEETVDPADSSSAAIISFVLAYCAASTGSPAAIYRRGWRASVPPY